MEYDGKARPLAFVLSEGQRGDPCFLEVVVDSVRVAQPSSEVGKGGRGRPRQRLGKTRLDKGYDGPSCRASLRARGLSHVIPEKIDLQSSRLRKGQRGGRPRRFDKTDYAGRNVIERCHLRMKQFRRLATRFEKRAAVFEAVVTLVSILLWIR